MTVEVSDLKKKKKSIINEKHCVLHESFYLFRNCEMVGIIIIIVFLVSFPKKNRNSTSCWYSCVFFFTAGKINSSTKFSKMFKEICFLCRNLDWFVKL